MMPKTLYAHACAHARYTNEMGRRLSLILVYCCDPDSHSHCPSPLLHVLANPDSIGLYSWSKFVLQVCRRLLQEQTCVNLCVVQFSGGSLLEKVWGRVVPEDAYARFTTAAIVCPLRGPLSGLKCILTKLTKWGDKFAQVKQQEKLATGSFDLLWLRCLFPSIMGVPKLTFIPINVWTLVYWQGGCIPPWKLFIFESPCMMHHDVTWCHPIDQRMCGMLVNCPVALVMSSHCLFVSL